MTRGTGVEALKEEVSSPQTEAAQAGKHEFWSVKDELEGERKKMEPQPTTKAQMQLQQAKQFAGICWEGLEVFRELTVLKGFNGSGRQYSMSNQYPATEDSTTSTTCSEMLL